MQKDLLDREVGKRVKALREECGITRTELAKKLGLTLSHMGLIERGQRGLTLPKCLMLRDIFCVSLEYLIAGSGETVEAGSFISKSETLSSRERQKISRFITEYSHIPPEKRNDDIVFDSVGFLLKQYIKSVRHGAASPDH